MYLLLGGWGGVHSLTRTPDTGRQKSWWPPGKDTENRFRCPYGILIGSSDSQSWFSGKGSEFCPGRSVSSSMTPCVSPSSFIWPVGTHPYPSWRWRAPPGSQAQAGHKHKSTLQALLVFNQRRLVLQQTIIESRCISSISSWCGTPHSVSAQGHRTPEGPCCSVHSPFGNYMQDKFGQWVSRSAEDEMMSGRVRSLNMQGWGRSPSGFTPSFK